MKSAFLIACLLAPVMLPAAFAQTPAEAEERSQVRIGSMLPDVLAGIEKLQAEDFYGAALVALEATGDSAAFYPMMEKISREGKVGSAAATVWLVPLELNRLSVAGADLATDPRAVELRARVEAATKKGYRPAFVQAANLLVAGIGGATDEAAAKRYLVQGSKLGCPQARAGFLMISGRLQGGGVSDPAVAAELKRNNHYLEEVIARAAGDTPEGVMWLRRAMEHGSASAPYVLAQSEAADLSEEESMEMLKLAAGRHHVPAMSLMGAVKMNASQLPGLPVEENREEGLQWLKAAAALGDAEALQTLATSMALGVIEGGKAAAPQLCGLYRMAAEQGHPQGMAGYGYCLMAGLGCTADPVRGEALLQRGIERGSRMGMLLLACAYYNGTGVKADLRRATNTLGEAAAMGHEQAYAIMAALTALGNEGIAPDAFRARIYLDMAKDEAGPAAQEVYDKIIADKGWRAMPALW